MAAPILEGLLCGSLQQCRVWAAKGLPALPALATMPGSPRWRAAFQMAQELLQRTVREMQDYFDERSEVWQQSERGEEHQEKIASAEAVLEALDELRE